MYVEALVNKWGRRETRSREGLKEDQVVQIHMYSGRENLVCKTWEEAWVLCKAEHSCQDYCQQKKLIIKYTTEGKLCTIHCIIKLRINLWYSYTENIHRKHLWYIKI